MPSSRLPQAALRIVAAVSDRVNVGTEPENAHFRRASAAPAPYACVPVGCHLDNPRGLAWLALLLPLVLLYLLKVRRKRRSVGAVWLWEQALRDAQAQQPFRRFTPQLPLILQALALLLLVLGLAQPSNRGRSEPADHVGIVLDVSASMGASAATGESRLAQAKQAVEGIIDGLAPGSRALLVAAGRRARLVAPLDGDRRRLRERLTSLEVEQVEGRLSDALALLNDRLAGLGGRNHIVLVTDGALAERTPLVSSLPVEELRVGSPVGNAAIVRFAVTESRAPGAPNQLQVLALLQNFSDRPRELDVVLRLRDATEPLASRRVTLAPGERAPLELAFRPQPDHRGRGLLVALSPGDSVAADDVAYGLVPRVRELPTVLAPKGRNPWLKRALLADPGVLLLEADPDTFDGQPPPHDALVILSGACPESLPGGDFLIVNPPPGSCRGHQIGPKLDRPAVTTWSHQDPRLRIVDFAQLSIVQSQAIRPASASGVLLGTDDHALMVDISLPGRTGTLLGFAPGDSNWPLQASFVLFVRNLVELARQNGARGAPTSHQTGDPVSLRVPSDVDTASLQGPNGSEPLKAHSGLAVVANTTRAGFYQVTWGGRQPDTRLLAVNLTSAAESDIRGRPVDWLARGDEGATATMAPPIQQLGWILSALGLGFLVADTWWYTRQRRLSPPTQASRRRRAKA